MRNVAAGAAASTAATLVAPAALAADRFLVAFDAMNAAINSLGVHRLGPELQLLIASTAMDASPAKPRQIRECLEAPINWESFLDKAKHHGLAALAFRELEEFASEGPFVPQEIRGRLLDAARQTAVRDLLRTQELLRLHALFCEHQLAPIPYKGPALSAVIYRDLTLREFGDLDFLIRPEWLPKIAEILAADAYQPEQWIPQNFAPDYMEAVADAGFINPATGIRLDFAWSLAPRHLQVHFDTDWCWQDLTSIEVNGTRLPALKPEKLLLALCVHGTKHGWERLKWICDVANLLRGKIKFDWDEICRATEASGTLRYVSVGLVLAHELYGVEIPEWLVADRSINALASDCLEMIKNSRAGEPDDWPRWKFLLKLQPGIARKLRSLHFFLLQPELLRNGIAASSKPRPFYQAWRAAGAIMKD